VIVTHQGTAVLPKTGETRGPTHIRDRPEQYNQDPPTETRRSRDPEMPNTDETDPTTAEHTSVRSADSSRGPDAGARGTGADETTDEESDVDHLADALRGTGEFVYGNSHRLIVVSLLWTLASLPVLTVGAATLGAYVAVGQLASDRNRIEWGPLFDVVRGRAVTATLYGLFPLVLLGTAGLYFVAGVDDGSILQAGLFFLTLYAGLYAGLVMVPTFVGLADGKSPRPALLDGIRWTAAHPTLAMLTGLITVVVLTASLLLTVAFPLLFVGVAAGFHHHIVQHAE
jgi:hypothetical protein